MRFWMRELLGWFLVFLGLFLCYWVISLLFDSPPKYLQSVLMTPIALIVFRGGIQLLKVAVAARMCSYAQTEAKKQAVRKPIGTAKETTATEW